LLCLISDRNKEVSEKEVPQIFSINSLRFLPFFRYMILQFAEKSKGNGKRKNFFKKDSSKQSC